MKRHLFKLLSLLFFLFAVTQAYKQAWVSDDAFISFRYSKNIANGIGAVYNTGERVEGYSNPLWTLLFVPVEFFHLDPVVFANAFGVIAYALLLISSFFIYKSIEESNEQPDMKQNPKQPFLSSFAFFAALSIMPHLQIFATSGLETMLFTLFVTSGTLTVARSLKAKATPSIGFLILSFALITRPDGFIIYFINMFYHLLHRLLHERFRFFRSMFSLNGFKEYGVIHIPALLLGGGWLLFRILYYNDIFPNTYYAKSASTSYISQGINYLFLFAKGYPFLSCFYLVSIVYFSLTFVKDIRLNFKDTEQNPLPLQFAIITLIWIVYIVYVGGDFMFARFLVPVTPLALLFIFINIKSMLSEQTFIPKQKKLTAPLMILVMLLSGIYVSPYHKDKIVINGIVEENRIYTDSNLKYTKYLAELYRDFFKENGVSIAFAGGQARLIYYLEPKIAIESVTGLTDYHISRQHIKERGRIGHEKSASLSYLQDRNITFWLRTPNPDDRGKFVRVIMEGIPVAIQLICADENLVERLKSNPRLNFYNEDLVNYRGCSK